nr:syntaxin-51 [Quercus suber]
MAATLNMSSFNNRDSLLGPKIKQCDIMNGTNGLNNHGLVGFQWKIMKEQNEDLEKLETVTSKKHIALAVSEKLNLHTRLLVGSFTDVDNLDQHVDSTDSHLQVALSNVNLLKGVGQILLSDIHWFLVLLSGWLFLTD